MKLYSNQSGFVVKSIIILIAFVRWISNKNILLVLHSHQQATDNLETH